MKRWLLLVLLCAASTVGAEQEVAVGGQRLRVVLDPRLKPEMVEAEWASGNPRTESPATLELVGGAGQVLDRLTLDAPLAKIDPESVRGAPHPTFLVSADLTREAGSYNGPLTLPVQIVDGHLVAATAVPYGGGHAEPIHLAATLKATWQRVADGGAEGFLQVSCQPRNGDFVTCYERYYLQRGKWQVKTRRRAGIWESDGDFPERKLFP